MFLATCCFTFHWLSDATFECFLVDSIQFPTAFSDLQARVLWLLHQVAHECRFSTLPLNSRTMDHTQNIPFLTRGEVPTVCQ